MTKKEFSRSYEYGEDPAMIYPPIFYELKQNEYQYNAGEIYMEDSRKRILITGAGTLGTELAKQLSENPQYTIFLLDNNEKALTDAMTIIGDKIEFIMGDIRDWKMLVTTFSNKGITTIIHTAAMKHVGYGERFPEELVKTNIIGSMNLLNLARALGVTTFINISSDKVCYPLNIYGLSKLFIERMVDLYRTEEQNFFSCRFGNFLGSRGSVIDKWKAQISTGRIRLSDPNMTRFFIKPEEVARFIIARAFNMKVTGVVIPIMKSLSMANVAKVFSEKYGVEIENIGPMKGEKEAEFMITLDEAPRTELRDDMLIVHPFVVEGKGLMNTISSHMMPRLDYDETKAYLEGYI